MKGVIIVLLVCVYSCSYAQLFPKYSSYYTNQYLYNPAALAIEENFELNLNYRKTLAGISESPSLGTISFQSPIGTNFALGTSIYNQKIVLLNNSSFNIAGAYRLNLAQNHFLAFGLSIGLSINSLSNVDGDLANDPALISLSDNTTYFNSQFGLFYRFESFQIGLAFPELTRNDLVDTDSYQKIAYGGIKNYVINSSYRFSFRPTSYYIQPIIFYRSYEEASLKNLFEGSLLVGKEDLLFVGAGYNNFSNINLYFGLTIFPKIELAYSYEMNQGNESSIQGSHEINLKFNFRKKVQHQKARKHVAKTNSKKIDNVGPIKATPIIVNQEIIHSKEEKTVKLEEVESTTQIQDNKENGVIEELNKEELMEKGLYVVIGVFSFKSNVLKYMDSIREKGLEATYKYNLDKEYYYVVLDREISTEAEARSLRNEIYLMPGLKDVWIFEYK